MQVSIITFMPCERSTNAWKEIFISPSGVAKCGCSQPCCLTYAAVSSLSSMEMLSSKAFTSTMRATSTSPIRQCLIVSALMESPGFSSMLTDRAVRGECRVDARRCRNATDHVRGLLRDHDHRGVGVAAHQVWKDRGVGHA